MTIVVTGATGQFGRLVIEDLRTRVPADQIVASTRNPAAAADLGVEVRHGDYDRPETLRTAFAGADKLLIVSTPAGESNEARAKEHIHAVAAAAELGVGQIVYTSITAADTAKIALARAHRPTEEAIEATGIPYTFLRNNWYLENDLGTVHGALANGTIATSSRGGKFAPVARADYARAAAAVLATDGHQNVAYELGAPVSYGYADWADAVSAETGREITYTEVDDDAATAGLSAAGVPAHLVELIVDFYQSLARGDMDVPSDDLVKLTGRQPVTPREFVAGVVRS
ncbi:MAG TPA: NAD(P)H-binding protein [Pseudonocardiaceae bacterium]|jgi:NAD(P)H dehydrogenase (quinone)|nr:NAD(P)H-binding protein [Pseudonocardiaceae bacterium]